MSRLVDFVTKDKQETSSVKVWDPDPFDGSDPKKFQGLLLECKLNFLAQLKAFCMENAKVNYAMSFLKGTALNYFELFLDTPDNEPAWLKDYELFIEVYGGWPSLSGSGVRVRVRVQVRFDNVINNSR